MYQSSIELNKVIERDNKGNVALIKGMLIFNGLKIFLLVKTRARRRYESSGTVAESSSFVRPFFLTFLVTSVWAVGTGPFSDEHLYLRYRSRREMVTGCTIEGVQPLQGREAT